MRERTRELRDRAVWVLARLSLAVLLSMMAALFVGSAAHAEGLSETAKVSGDGFDQANPLGLVLVGLVVAVGVGVLVVAAFRPERRSSRSELAELLRD